MSPSVSAAARELAELEAIESARLRKAVRAMTLETLLTHEGAFGLTTATKLQRAICRVADGQPMGDLMADTVVQQAIGDTSGLTSGQRPRELVVLSGIRTAKSLMAAAIGVRAALTCDVSRLRPGETPRVSIVSLKKDLGDVVLNHLIGTVKSKAALAGLMVGEPTSDAVTLKHPSGKHVEIMVVAGAKAGGSLVARWSAGCIFDEAPRMNGEEDGVINFDDARRAVLGRLLPGAQLIAIGSPWAPRGPIYEAVQEHWHKPSAEIVVVRAPATAMNPYWWTPERVEALKRQDEQAYRTDVLGEFADPESSMFTSVELDRATRRGDPALPREAGHSYVAAMDPGTRGNAWTLVVCTRRRRPSDGKQRTSVVLAKQWIGSKAQPLNPDTVMGEVAEELRAYGLEAVWTDQLAADFVRAIGVRHGLGVYDETVTAPRKVEIYESLRMRLADDGLEIPDDAVLRGDLLSVRKRVTTNGVAIELPRTADGRHADFAAALALAASKPLSDAPLPEKRLTAEERLAGLRQAEDARWREIERKGDEAAANSGRRNWLEALEDVAYGDG